jgi:hypothetical protein
LLASFVVNMQRLPDVRAVNKVRQQRRNADAGHVRARLENPAQVRRESARKRGDWPGPDRSILFIGALVRYR